MVLATLGAGLRVCPFSGGATILARESFWQCRIVSADGKFCVLPLKIKEIGRFLGGTTLYARQAAG